MTRRPRIATLIAGLALVGLGAWILLDASGDVRLSFVALGPALAAICGAILLTSGIEERRPDAGEEPS